MKSTNKTPNGTSYWSNNITATVTQLKAILGEPVFCDNDGSDKVNFEWNLETDNGDVFTVYDWKEYRPISEDEIIVWHIGGINGSVTIQAQSEVNAALTTQPKEPTHITWWKGLNEEEKYKLCCKHFQGIPVESLMERSIKVMYHYENPSTTEKELSTIALEWWNGLNEVAKWDAAYRHSNITNIFFHQKLEKIDIEILYKAEHTQPPTTNTVTGEGFTGGWKVINWGQIAQIRDADHNEICVCGFGDRDNGIPDEQTTAIANRIVNCVNNFDSLVSALKKLQYQLQTHAESNAWDMEDEAAYEEATTVLNQINQL